MVKLGLGEDFSFSEGYPQFFKVFLPHKSSQELQIPPEFVKHFDGVLPCNSTITSLERRSWQVELNTVNDYLYFHKGWDQFVLDNSLEFGDLLLFYYGGNAKFYAKIYGKNGCLKEPTAPTSDIHGAISLSQENQTVEHRKSKWLAAEKNLGLRFPMELQKESSALKEAQKFKSKLPFFKVVMRSTYVPCGPVHIPVRFIISNMEEDRRDGTLVVSDKSWPVRVKSAQHRRNVCMITRGWRLFCRENTLKTGDVCVFELIDRNDFVLKVYIFRCLD